MLFPDFLFGGELVEQQVISSKQNEQIKWAKRLLQKKYRDQESLFSLEGARLVEEALASNLVHSLYYNERVLNTKRGVDLVKKVKTLNIPCFECTWPVFLELCDTVNPQGVVAIVRKPAWPAQNRGLIVIADEIQDPGNLGTLLRTSLAAGAQGVIIVDGSVDLYNPKVVRSSMGAIFQLPHWFLSRETTIDFVLSQGLSLVIADLVDAKNYWSVTYPQDLAVVIGNEARGIHPEFREQATLRVKIPLQGSAESLNASVATGILLYEILRQQTFSEPL